MVLSCPLLPDGASIPIITPPNSIQEPLIFISPVTKIPIVTNLANSSLLEHQGAKRTLTQIKITTSSEENISPEIQWFCEQNFISISKGREHHLELEWDLANAGQVIDFRPTLPMSIRW